jgi:PAS domain S-box-containing protein
MGVVTGIPMEFQFGTNRAAFSRAAGGVIGQTLAMEGIFSFFLESSFLGLLLFGEKQLGPRDHRFATFTVFLGCWLSGYLIVATDAWMQHPTGYRLGSNGEIMLSSFWGLLLNPWALWQYAHNMTGAVITGSFAMTAMGLLSQPVETLVPERFRSARPARRKSFHAQPQMRPMGVGVELHGRRKDGSEFPVDVLLSPVETTEGRAVLSVIHDISAREASRGSSTEKRDAGTIGRDASRLHIRSGDIMCLIIFANIWPDSRSMGPRVASSNLRTRSFCSR